MKRLFFDIETVLNPGVIDLMPEPAAPANLKDPEKITAAIEEKKREMIEKAALDADYGRILSIGYSSGDGDNVHVMVNEDVYPDCFLYNNSEEQMLKAFWNLFKECGGACVGYNILGFDLPYLMRRSMALGVKLPFIPNLAKYRTEPITDLMMIIYNWGSDKYKSLKQVAKLYGIENGAPEVGGSMVSGLDAEQLIAYQISDVKMVMALYEKMNGVYFVHR